jgi:hypothetical protein
MAISIKNNQYSNKVLYTVQSDAFPCNVVSRNRILTYTAKYI